MMHRKNYRLNIRPLTKHAGSPKRGWLLVLVLLITLTSMPGLGANPVFALPPEPIDPDPVGGSEPVAPPENGFDWSVPARFGPFASGIVDYHWIADSFNPYVPGHYDPTYVHPATFPVNLDGCRNDNDEIAGTSPMTYTWTLDGQTTTDHTCRFQHVFNSQGTYPVSLTMTDTNGSVVLDAQERGNPFTQNVVVKDILIVSLGDSYASGEGSPDESQVLGDYFFGQPTQVLQPARWQDLRCHRSANASPALAARMIEAADPHTSVTFLSFACSGATINTPYYADASPFDPYRNPGTSGWTKLKGTGILGPYAGIPPDANNPQNNQIPSQIDQVVSALNTGGAPRQIDALIISGGGNDIGFSLVASLCTLYYDCKNYDVTDASLAGPERLELRVQEDIGFLPGKYTALASAINTRVPLNANGKVYITQYPDSTRNDQGGFCAKMLDDVIPFWMQPLLAIAAALDDAVIPLPPYQIDGGDRPDGGEVGWAGGAVLPGLNGAVGAAAQAHGWTLVDGIADNTANLFSGHGYCASDNWIRRAADAVNMQGPWVPWNESLLPPASTQTTGTLHPTAQGYQAVANRIFAKLASNLLPPPSPSGPPPAPSFAGSSTQSLVGANGWLIGHSAGASCPAGAANCALVQEVASVDGSTAVRGASLLINGTRPTCSISGVTTNGLTCQAQLTNAQTYSWSLAFANDGLYRLEFTVSARNGTVSKLIREIHIDLHDPTVTSTLSAPTPTSGWYQLPVTLTLTGADGSGSGIQNIQVQLDGATTVVGGNRIPLQLAADGVHTIAYQVADFAGRMSPLQSLTVQIDQTKPTSSSASSPAPNGTGWNKNDVMVTLSATDNGGSGIQSFTYSATGAQSIASTTVSAGTPTQFTVNTEGVTAITFGATDVAGNVEANKTLTIKLDKTVPSITLTTPTSTAYTLNQAVAANYACVDAGSGVAACNGPVPNNSNIDTASPGSKTFSVNASDNAGNVSNQSVSYKVSYNICVLFDQSRSYKLGSTVPIKLQVCDMKSVNFSAAGIVVHATGLTQKDSTASGDVVDSGNANPDNDFRYDATLNGYIFNLGTKGLATGTWLLNFNVAGDPISHVVPFDVK